MKAGWVQTARNASPDAESYGFARELAKRTDSVPTCRDMSELVTDYMEHAAPHPLRNVAALVAMRGMSPLFRSGTSHRTAAWKSLAGATRPQHRRSRGRSRPRTASARHSMIAQQAGRNRRTRQHAAHNSRANIVGGVGRCPRLGGRQKAGTTPLGLTRGRKLNSMLEMPV